MAQVRFDSRIRARVNTFRALTYKLLVLAAEHVERSCRMSMRQGLQAIFHTSSFDANSPAMGSTAGCPATGSRWGAAAAPLHLRAEVVDHRFGPSKSPRGHRGRCVSAAQSVQPV